MPIEDVFSISGRGTVVTGRVETGIVKVGEEVEIVGIKDTKKTVVTGVEMFRKLLDQGQAGDNIGALIRGVGREEVERGQVLAKPGSITPHTDFSAEVYVLSKDEGGRHTPFFANYRPQFYFRTTDVTGEVVLPEGTEMVMPGDNVSLEREADRADRHGPGPALRDPRRRPDRRRGGCRQRSRSSKGRSRPGREIRAASRFWCVSLSPSGWLFRIGSGHGNAEYPHSPEGLRSSCARSGHRGHRRHRSAHGCADSRSHSAADAYREVHREPLARTSTRSRASSSRFGRTRGCSTSCSPRRRRSTR